MNTKNNDITYTQVIYNKAMENVPFMDDLPDKNRVFPYVFFSISLVKLPTGPVKKNRSSGDDFTATCLVNVNKKRWKDPPCYSWVNIHYFDWAMFNSFL